VTTTAPELEHVPTLAELGISEKLASEYMELAAVALELLAERQPDTVRGIMYAVVSIGYLPDTTDKSYNRIQRILNVLRKKRVIPFGWIVDNIRDTDKPSSWSGLADYADTVADCYRKDFWAELPEYVCIIVEKDTVAGRIAQVTRKYDVALHPLRGFCSTSFAHEIGEQWRETEKPIHCYYIGDHDPSGRDIERSARERLAEFSEREFSWTRLAVEPEQFEEYSILPIAPKKRDTRYQRFTDEYGDRCAEVEAIPANVLRQMVRDAIMSHIPADQWKRLQAVEAKEKESWRGVMGKIGGAA
jgi:hypothetical protein